MPVCPRCQAEHPDVGVPCPNDNYYFVPESSLDDARRDELIGTLLADKYVILGHLAAGGMGAIYRALQLPVERRVAVKVLHAEVDRTDTGRKRFAREARAISRLSHPNIITLHDFGFDDQHRPYMVMEYVEGQPLSSWIEATDPSIHHLMHVAHQILAALSEAHDRDIIHRDLKPANVLVTRAGHDDNFVKLLDFGLARFVDQKRTQQLTRHDEVFGTPHYMSPEQARGDSAIGPRSDVYSMGVLLFWLCSGRVPFDAPQPLQVLFQHLHEEIPDLKPRPGIDLPPQLEDVIRRAMNKEPVARYVNADAMLDALEDAIERSGLSQTLRRPKRSPTPRGIDNSPRSDGTEIDPGDRKTVQMAPAEPGADPETDPSTDSSSQQTPTGDTRREWQTDDDDAGSLTDESSSTDETPIRETAPIATDDDPRDPDASPRSDSIRDTAPVEESAETTDSSRLPMVAVAAIGIVAVALGGVAFGLYVASPTEEAPDREARLEASADGQQQAAMVDTTAAETAPEQEEANPPAQEDNVETDDDPSEAPEVRRPTNGDPDPAPEVRSDDNPPAEPAESSEPADPPKTESSDETDDGATEDDEDGTSENVARFERHDETVDDEADEQPDEAADEADADESPEEPDDESDPAQPQPFDRAR